jgi:hypothetical protein
MSADSTPPDLAELSVKLGQLIRTGELQVAGKLLATARGHLHQLADKEPIYQARYEHVALLRNELMEPDRDDFDGKRLLVELLDEEKHLRRAAKQHPSQQVSIARVLLHAAGAIVLVHCQDLESEAPLDF